MFQIINPMRTILLLVVLALVGCNDHAGGVIPNDWAEEFVPGRILVKLADDVEATVTGGIDVIEPLGIVVVEVVVDAGESDRDATLRRLAELQADPNIAWAEPDYIARIFPAESADADGRRWTQMKNKTEKSASISVQRRPIPALVPTESIYHQGTKTQRNNLGVFVPSWLNDPRAGEQWGLWQVDAPAAWDIQAGSPDVAVAIIDTGWERTHPDLAGRVILEKDYVNGDDFADDDHGHGTHVTGIAGANTGNGIGVAGTAPNAALWHCKGLGATGAGSYSDVARCMVWAAGNGAKVLSLSLGGPAQSQTLKDAVQYAREHAALVVAAGGNSPGSGPQYPAAYPGVLAVAATDQGDRRASFSSYGSWVDLSAPGLNILSTCRGSRYCSFSGTSMSAPFVAGAAALLFSDNPGMTDVDMLARLQATADPVADLGMGAGRLNIWRALTEGESPTPPTATPTSGAPPPATSTPAQDAETRTVQLVNAHRQAGGLPALPVDGRLVQAARRHSQDMEQTGFCGHFGSDGSNPFDRMRDAGYSLVTGGEIVACGYVNPEGAVAGWQASPAHNSIMLHSIWSDIGCGVVAARYTCVFGLRSDAPEPPATPTAIPTAIPTTIPTATPPASGFWLWCVGEPLHCEEQMP